MQRFAISLSDAGWYFTSSSCTVPTYTASNDYFTISTYFTHDAALAS